MPGYGIASDTGDIPTDKTSSGKTKARDPKTKEPVFYHSKGMQPFEEFFHMLGGKRSIKRVVDLTPGDGIVAHWCCQNRVSYMGFVFTEVHGAKLKTHLQEKIFNDMKTEGNVLYKNGLATLLETIEIPSDDEKAKAKSKPKSKGKAATPPKAKGKAAKATAANGSEKKPKTKGKAKAKGKISKAISGAKRKSVTAGEDPEEDDEGEEEESEMPDSASEEPPACVD